MLTLLGTPNTRTTRVTWALEEAGAEYEFVAIDLIGGGAKTPEYRDLNPGGKVPTLLDGEHVITESAAIVIHVADRFPDAGIIPTEPVARARCLQWCFFTIGELEQPLWTMSKHSFALPPDWRTPAIMPTAAREWLRAAKVLAAGLGDRRFILGDDFSVADIMLAHTLAWSRFAKQPIEHENLQAYAGRVLSRPALARARAREAAAKEQTTSA